MQVRNSLHTAIACGDFMVCKIEDVFFKKEGVLYGAREIRDLLSYPEYLGAGSVVDADIRNNKILRVIEKKDLESQSPFWCFGCGHKFNSLKEILDHTKICKLKGYST